MSQDDSSKGGSWSDIWGAPTRYEKNGKTSIFISLCKSCPYFYVFYSSHENLVNVPANSISRRGGKGESKASSGCSKEVARVLKERRRQASNIQTSRGSAQQGVRTQQSETLGNITGILNPNLLHV
jgi:hypothetical protein